MGRGNLALEITVDVDGRVRDAMVTKGLDSDLDASAVAAVSTWLFKPGTIAGKPVPVRTTADIGDNLAQGASRAN
jgi:TonB family protein